MTNRDLNALVGRRAFLIAAATGAGCLLCPAALRAAGEGAPTDNPLASYKLPWTDQAKWANVVDVTRLPGVDADEKLAAAQTLLVSRGGGVAFFPAGVYQFKDSIKLQDGVILRGQAPASVTRAHDDKFALPTRFEFPKFNARLEGDGTPITTAFKGIYLENPATASNVGVVHIDINHGHIKLAEAPEYACGANRFVVGCILRNAAQADPAIPDLAIGQKPWQRYTWRFGPAIDVKSAQNALIANNRLPRSGDDNFTQPGFLLRNRQKKLEPVDVVFDYDNRAGIYLNHYGIGGPGGQGPDGSPESHPYGFRKGLVIRDNFLFQTGRCAIGFCGDGVHCAGNIIRFAKDVWRPTVTGKDITFGSSTNDNRAIEMRGWRWIVEDNDYDVRRNWAHDRKYYINDGEGLMHEDHVNSTVKDSILRNNRGNTYLSIYHTAGIDGLLVEGNDIRLATDAAQIPAIYVVAHRVYDAFPCRNVTIANNTVAGGGILIGGDPAENNVVKGNKAVGGPLPLLNRAQARLEGNQGFKEETGPWTFKKRK